MAEKAAGLAQGDLQVGISGDSQVCLGAINKGRSASPALNWELQKSLPFCLGLGIYSFAGYTRTKFNPADDTTRGREVREPELEILFWWVAAKEGDFASVDSFLESCNLLPEQISSLPPVDELFPPGEPHNGTLFDKPKNQRHKGKTLEKLVKRKHQPPPIPPYDASLPWSEEARHVLMTYGRTRFILQDQNCWPPTERGFVDLFSGHKGFARAATHMGAPWVLTFEINDGSEQDLANKEVRHQVGTLLRGGAVMHLSAAPTCASFSRAVTSPVRNRQHPAGILGLKFSRPKVYRKVLEGNSFSSWLSEIIDLCCILGVVFWIENPDTSFFWYQRSIKHVIAKHSLGFYRCDFCRYKTKWRKRARFCTNSCLRDQKDFCTRDHVHIRLRGRSSVHGCCWTKAAEPYPRGLCSKLAWAAAYELELLPRKVRRRIGEAKNSGPGRHFPVRTVPDLESVELIKPATVRLGIEQWDLFLSWGRAKLGRECLDSCLAVPGLIALLLRRYGKHLYEQNKLLYLYRHLIIHGQRIIPALRQASRPVWELVSRWEAVEPIRHRPPVPFSLMLAMVNLALSWKWYRWSRTALLAFFGACRPEKC